VESGQRCLPGVEFRCAPDQGARAQQGSVASAHGVERRSRKDSTCSPTRCRPSSARDNSHCSEPATRRWNKSIPLPRKRIPGASAACLATTRNSPT
jgi:hypothetical protein